MCREEFHRALYVDHNHETGKVRALICARCNTGLGFYEKNPGFFQRAKKYLNEYDVTRSS